MDRMPLQDPPERGHPDRKRALNVLAQRRYRKRIRTKLAALKENGTHITTIENPAAPVSLNHNTSQSLPSITDHSINTTAFPETISTTENISNSYSPDQSCNVLGDVNAFSNSRSQLARTLPFGNTLSTEAFDSFVSLENDPTIFNDASMGNELQRLEISLCTFPDDRTLEIPALKLMRIGLHAAEMVRCIDSIWNPAARRVLNLDDLDVSNLPPNMWPTSAQAGVSHHPLFDILPWPSVRDKLIFVFELPLSQRPAAAQDANAIVNLIYDMDDATEGFRVVGEAGFEPDNWEVGQAFFQNWWWALDRSVIARSNSMRRARGLQPLRIISTYSSG